LQVIEFMAAHGRNKDGDYTYHHCAELQIRANPNKPTDTRFPAENKQRWDAALRLAVEFEGHFRWVLNESWESELRPAAASSSKGRCAWAAIY
jgi:hypothetical protein